MSHKLTQASLDREAARRQRLRGAQTRDVVDADTSFGFRLPGQPSTIKASEVLIVDAQATPTPAATREGRQNIRGTKRASPTGDTGNAAPDIIRAQVGSIHLVETNEQAAKRQRIEPSTNEDPTFRAASRNARLRGADLRSPGVGVQDFGFILPPALAAPSAPRVATTETNLQPADFTPAPAEEGNDTLTLRAQTPEFQVLAETTNASIRSSGAASGSRSLRSSVRRNKRHRSTQERSVEVSGSPPDRPGSGRRVRALVDRTENSDAAETAAGRLNDVMNTPTRTRGGSLGREASPTLAVERPRERAEERRDEDGDVDMDELSPDRPKAVRTSSPLRSNIDEDVSLESVRESIEGKGDDADEEAEASPISDQAAAAAHRRNRAPKGTYVEPRRDGKDLDEDDDASDQYEESADEDADPDNLTAAQQRKRLAKVGRKRKSGADIASPAVQKPAKNKTAARTAWNADGSESRKRGRPRGSKNNPKAARANVRGQNMGPRSKETIAVQTYRLSEFAPAAELVGEEEEEEILTQPIPFPNLPRNTGGVNSIDVLSQMLNEVLQSALESLEQGAARADDAAQRRQTAEKVAERREYRTKLRAVEAWGEAAGGALMEMGLGLDAAVAMSKRVKEVERERIELRERLGEIRRERERVGVRGDGVRSRHEREGAKRMADRELQNAIEGVTVVVGVCREQDGNNQDEEEAKGDIITRLKETASLVSSKRDVDGITNGEGLLERLKRMNSLLERAAGALEGR